MTELRSPKRDYPSFVDQAGGSEKCAVQRLAGVAKVLAIVINRQEVSPMNAVSAMGAPLQSTISRLS
jgi:hypothetical protein